MRAAARSPGASMSARTNTKCERRRSRMAATVAYNPEQWRDFFTMVGGASAALTGLVFVAMSLNVRTVTQDPTHRYRAIGTLTAFVAVFMISAFGLMGNQTHIGLGAEWFIIAAGAGIIYVNGYLQALKQGGSVWSLYRERLVVGTANYLAQMTGACLLLLGDRVGIYIAAIAMIAYFPYAISGAWLLIVRVYDDKIKSEAQKN
jgi:hypothetical protein